MALRSNDQGFLFVKLFYYSDDQGMRGNGPQGQINPASGMGGPGNSQGLLSSQGLQALQSIQGQSGGNGNGGRMGPGQGQSVSQTQLISAS